MNVRIVPADLHSAGPHLAALGQFDSGELEEAAIFLVTDDAGAEIGAYALKVKNGNGWVFAAVGGLPGHDLTAEFLPAIERQLRLSGCRRAMIRTARAGLVKKLDAAGWNLESTILEKTL